MAKNHARFDASTARAYTRRQTVHRPESPLKLHLAHPEDNKLFTSYADDHVVVSRERFDANIVVHTHEVLTDWDAQNFDSLTEAHFEYFLALKPEVVLIGTGKKQRFAHPRLYRSLTEAGIGVEFMDTPAACRTYNILAEEDRKVVAAILL